MADMKLELTQEAEQNIAQTLDTLIEAANEIAKASEQDFEKLKSKKWYKRLWELVTYSRDNEKIQARGVANLAKLNEIIMKAIVLLSKQNKDTAELVYHSLEEIKALQNDVGNIYDNLDKVIETLICIKRGFKSETRFDELSDSSKDIICAIVFKFAEENNLSNPETQLLLYTLKTNAHTASSDIEYDCVDNLNLDAQKVLYSILQAYIFLFKNDFDSEENSEIFDSLSLSKKDKERQKATIKKELNLLGAEGYIKLLENNAGEYEFYNYITDDYIEFAETEILVEQVYTPLYDYSALKNLIKSYIDVDKNGVSATFGQLITDVAKYSEYFSKVKAHDLSSEAIIYIFQAEKALIFTTNAIYYESWNTPLLYSTLDVKQIADTYGLNGDSVTLSENHSICDTKVDEIKLRKLVVDIAENKENLEFSITDRNKPFKEFEPQTQILYFALLLYIFRKNDRPASEVLRYCLDNKFNFSWNEVCDAADQIITDQDYELTLDKIFSCVEYPSEKSISTELMALALRLFFYEMTNLKSTTLPYETEVLIKQFDKNNTSDKVWKTLCISAFNNVKYIRGEITAAEYVNSSVVIAKMLSKADGSFAASAIIPYVGVIPFSVYKIFNHLKNNAERQKEIKSSEQIYKEQCLIELNSYKNMLLYLCDNSFVEINKYKESAYTALESMLKTIFGTYTSNDFVNAFLYDAPEILFGCKPSENKTVLKETETAQKWYYAYKIDNAMVQFKVAAEKGCGRACYYLGEIYAQGYGGVTKDRALAEEWRKKGMQRGDVLSSLNYAYMQSNVELKKDIYKLVLPMLEKLAEQDDVAAQFELSDMYYKGLGTTVSKEKGFYWLKKSADLGHFKQMNKLACFYWTKKAGAEKNKDEAVRLWKMAANLCYEPAVYNIFKQKSLIEYKDKFEIICTRKFAPALNYRGWLKLNGFNGYTKNKSIYDDIKISADLNNPDAIKNYETYKKKGKVSFFSYSYEYDPIY